MQQQLMSLMRLASKYLWVAVFSFHIAVLDRIEAGLANWGDDFSEIERFNITKSNRLPRNRPMRATTNPISPQPMATGSVIIAVNGILPAPAITHLIHRERNTSVRLVKFLITPSLRARLDQGLPLPAD